MANITVSFSDPDNSTVTVSSGNDTIECPWVTKEEDDIAENISYWVEGIISCCVAILGLVANFISAIILLRLVCPLHHDKFEKIAKKNWQERLKETNIGADAAFVFLNFQGLDAFIKQKVVQKCFHNAIMVYSISVFVVVHGCKEGEIEWSDS